MKQPVKTIVDSIEKEIQSILENPEYASNIYGLNEDFEFGYFTYDFSINEIVNPYLDDWDAKEYKIEIEPKSVTVTNENSKTLTNLSKEVFNQLETTYTNY